MPASVHAEGVVLLPAAQKHYDAGLKLYEEGAYPEASHEFEQAYLIDASPGVLFSWAQSERNDQHCPKAIELYKKYIASGVSPSQREATLVKITECELTVPIQPTTPPPPPQVHARWYTSTVGDALVISGAVSLGVGLAYLALASDTTGHLSHDGFLDDFRADLDTASSQRTVGVVALSVGAALVGGGVFACLHHRSTLVSPVTAGTDGRLVFVRGSF